MAIEFHSRPFDEQQDHAVRRRGYNTKAKGGGDIQDGSLDLLRQIIFPRPAAIEYDREVTKTFPTTPWQNNLLQSDSSSKQAWMIRYFSIESEEVDPSTVCQTWCKLVKMNSILRTSILLNEESPSIQVRHQVYKRAIPMTIANDIEQVASFWMRQSKRAIFNLRPEPIYLPSSQHGPLILLIYPKVLMDDTSFLLLKSDYLRLLRGENLTARALVQTQLVNYNVRFNPDKALAFWKSRLSNMVPPIIGLQDEHSSHRQSSVTQASHSHGNLSYRFDSWTFAALKQICRANDLSLQCIMEAIWALTVSVHTGTNHVLFCSAIRGTSTEVETQILGLLDHILPMPVHVDGKKSLLELAQAIRDLHRQNSRYLGACCLTILEQLPKGCESQSLLRFTGPQASLLVPHANLKANLEVDFDLTSGSATFTFSNRYASSKVDVVAHHFMAGLNSFAATPSATIESIQLLSEEERAWLLSIGAPKARPKPRLVHDLFEERARTDPNATAIETLEGRQVSFNKLNMIANEVAWSFIRRNIQDQYIPVCMDVSIDFVAALFGILKSGNAYTILDPQSSPVRNKAMAEDLSPPLVLCDDAYEHNFTSAETLTDLICKSDVEKRSINPRLDLGVDSPSYVIYTSGTSGKPKGVVIEHQAAANGIQNYVTIENLRALLFYNPIFSAAQRTILATLISGGCLCLAPRPVMVSSLYKVIQRLRINTLGATSSVLSLLNPEDVPMLKQITLTGETVDFSLVNIWAEHGCLLRNNYGLSENTQINMGRKLERNSNPRIVGRANDTTATYVLMQGRQELAPRLVVGELCLGGHQLSRGYHNLKDLTMAKFIENPFGGGRLYRTGDLARVHVDGSIEILGRNDFQVKVNGQRVETGEIKRVLQQHPLVSAVEVVGVNVENKTFIVAHLILDEENDRQGEDEVLKHIKRHARSHLPTYMVPQYWRIVEDFPLNANGKLDIHALQMECRELGRDGLIAGTPLGTDEAPSDASQEALQVAISEVLQIPLGAVRRNSGFMDIGGSSIDAIKVANILFSQGVNVSVGELLGMEEIGKVTTQVAPAGTDLETRPFALKPSSFDTSTLTDEYEDAFPVTALQEGILTETFAGSDDYLYQRLFDVGGLDLPRLRRAFTDVVRERPMLRTTFFPAGKSFVQVVKKDMDLEWNEVNTKVGVATATDSGEESFSAILQQDKERSVRFGEPFFRVSVLDSKVLVLSCNHALFDYWSHRFLFDDVASAYLNVSSLASRPAFRSFVQGLDRLDKKEQAGFWTNYMAGSEPCLLGMVDQGPRFNVTERLDIDLRKLEKVSKITLGSAVYASWAMVLRRHTVSENVIFAVTLSGRDQPIAGIGQLDGPTLATVPLRVSVTGSRLLHEIAHDVQQSMWDISSHAQVGLKGALAAGGFNPSNRSIDTLVNFLPPPERNSVTSSIFKTYGRPSTWQSAFITLEVQRISDERISISVQGASSERLASTLLQQTVMNLENFVLHPKSSIQTALSDTGRKRTTDPMYGEELSGIASHLKLEHPAFMFDAFQNIARAQPNRLAIQWLQEEFITYQQLDEASSQMAHKLCQLGVRPGLAVPLVLDKGPRMMIAILAVLKAGGAYVPLNPENPAERNDFVIRKVNAQVILADPEHATKLDNIRYTIVSADEDFSSQPTGQPAVDDFSVYDPAYIIFTSGSTGEPKGVMISHAAATSAVASMAIAEGRFESEWRVLQFANYVFDASVQDIFNALSTGGCLCMAPASMLLSDLARTIELMDVRQAILTPTVAKLLSPDEVPSMETLILGGEPMTQDIVDTWAHRVKLLNVYGPTEASMVSTTKHLLPGDNSRNIGRPLDTARAIVLVPQTTDVAPYGAIGELAIIGPQLADGYFGRDDLTAKAFIEVGHQRVYRTGDLVQENRDGDFIFYGRIDKQIKIHGHRIELEEIEHAADRLTEVVKQSVALVDRSRSEGDIVLCLNTHQGHGDDGSKDSRDNIRDVIDRVGNILRSTLATYMLPKYIFVAKSFPKLISQKVDRKKLGEMIRSMSIDELALYSLVGNSFGDRPTLKPETDRETLLCEVFSDIFSIDIKMIGRNSSFMALGGDSIMAIRLVGACRQRGYKVAVHAVLSSFDIQSLAMELKEIGIAASAIDLYPIDDIVLGKIQSHGIDMDCVEDIFPCPPGQLDFLKQGFRPERYWNLMAVRELPEDFNIVKWIDTTQELTRRNGLLRSTFVELDSGRKEEALQVTFRHEETPLPFSTVVCSTTEERNAILKELRQKSFKMGELFITYHLLELPDNRRELVVSLSHALYDGQLLRIFDDQFKSLWHGQQRLMEPKTSFKQYALSIWQTPIEPAINFWKKLLIPSSGDSPVSNSEGWPMRLSNPQSDQVITIELKRSNIAKDAAKLGGTAAALFQAAFQIWLGSKAGSGSHDDVRFDLLATGRDLNGLEDAELINGTCANFVPFQIAKKPRGSAEEYVKLTQSLYWQATEASFLTPDAIYRKLGLSPESEAAQCLFLFQPFEPPRGPASHNCWIKLAISQVSLLQPYAIVVEVSKTLHGHKMKLFYDQRIFASPHEAEQAARAMENIVDQLLALK